MEFNYIFCESMKNEGASSELVTFIPSVEVS